MGKLGLERNDPTIATLSAVGSLYTPAFPAKNGYLHQFKYPYSGWVSNPNPSMFPSNLQYIYRVFPTNYSGSLNGA